jgi:hypothetical protein
MTTKPQFKLTDEQQKLLTEAIHGTGTLAQSNSTDERIFLAGYTAGCSAMREAAAAACLQALKDHHAHSNFICEQRIRALPDPPGGTP